MAAEFYTDDGTAWQRAKEVYFDDGTVWRRVTEAYFDDGTAWRTVFRKAVDFATAAIVNDGGAVRFNWSVNGQAYGAQVRLYQGAFEIDSGYDATLGTVLTGSAPSGTFTIELYDPDGSLLDTFSDTF